MYIVQIVLDHMLFLDSLFTRGNQVLDQGGTKGFVQGGGSCHFYFPQGVIPILTIAVANPCNGLSPKAPPCPPPNAPGLGSPQGTPVCLYLDILGLFIQRNQSTANEFSLCHKL